MQQENATLEALATKRTDLMLVDPKNLVIEANFNVRFDYGDIPGLALSIVSRGVEEPLIGYKLRGEDKYIVTDGHRREKAIQLALDLHAKGDPRFADISKIAYVPMRTASADPIERLFTMAITGEKKKSLTDLERAAMYQRLLDALMKTDMKRGDAINKIKQDVGISTATLYNMLKLNTLPEQIKTAIAENKISGSTVVTIVREIKGEDEQIKAVTDAIADAQEVAEKEGGRAKATASNVKNLKAKTAMQRLQEVVAKLHKDDVSNTRTKLLIELVDALENKRSVNKIVELFL